MSISAKCYVLEDDGSITLITRRLYDLLNEGQETIREYAGQKKRFVDVIVELQDRVPTNVLEVHGHYLKFDDVGRPDVPNILRYALESVGALLDSGRKVVGIQSHIAKRDFEREHLFEPTPEEYDRIYDAALSTGSERRVRVTTLNVKSKRDKDPPRVSASKIARIKLYVEAIGDVLDDLEVGAFDGYAKALRRLGQEPGSISRLYDAIAGTVESLHPSEVEPPK